VRFAAIILGVALALVIQTTLQTTLTRFVVRGVVAVDLVLVAVVYVALISGPTTGMLTGSVAGLIQDAGSSSGIWVGGLVKTIVGFLGGIIGTQFIVTQSLPRFVVFFTATLVHAALKMGLYVLLGIGDFGAQPYGPVLWQAAANAVAGVVAFQLVESVPGAVERRRAARPRLRR
jgi:rod shape-determining protein MreD